MKLSHLISSMLLVLFLVQCSDKKKIARTVSSTDAPAAMSIESILKKIPGIEVTSIANNEDYFTESFKLMIEQPIDHSDLSKGTFRQKVYLSHKDFDAPMVLYLSGYNADNNSFISEITKHFSTNQISVEHRYFGESIPDDNYAHLTIEQSAADHHAIVEKLKFLYKNDWINTGISKGGQTVLYHRALYPYDIMATVAYVAPINLSLMDDRLEKFLDEVGTEECRNKILNYQRSILENREEALKLFSEKSNAKSYTYPFSLDSAMEISLFEFEFAFWQWDGNCTHIPASESSLLEKMDFLFQIDAPGFFTDAGITGFFPFFYQSYTQMGMYGYEVEGLEDLLQAYKSDFSNYRTFISDDYNLEYDGSRQIWVNEWLQKKGNNIIYIYGELDPWAATSFQPIEGNTNALKFVKSGGNHGTRIASFSKEEQEEIWGELKAWMDQN